MEKRDFLMVQIEQLGRAIGQVLVDLLNLKKSGKTQEGIELSISILNEEIGFDLEKLISMNKDDFFIELEKGKKINYSGLENLADILYEIGLEKDVPDSILYYKKALLIYDHIIRDSGTYSIQWTDKISRIEESLSTG